MNIRFSRSCERVNRDFERNGLISTIDFLKARFTESLEHKGGLRHLSNSMVRPVFVTPKTEIGTLECDYSLFHSSLKTSV